METTVTETEPVRDRDTDYACFVKAKDNGEITFTLRSQDATADLVVDFWMLVQLRVSHSMKFGMTLAQALTEARDHFGIPEYPVDILVSPKLNGAVKIAHAMRAWSNRKLAD